MQTNSRLTIGGLAVLFCLGPVSAIADVEVIAVYEGQRAYLDAALAEADPDLATLAMQHLAEPYAVPCSKGLSDEDVAYVKEKLGTPIEDLDQLAKSLDAMERFDTAAMIEEQMRRASALLPSDDLATICVGARDPATIRDFKLSEKLTKGVAGQHYGAGIIWMSIYPFSGWTDVATFTAPHEYHHFVRAQIPRENLLDVIVAEGLADGFALIVNDGVIPNEDWYTVMEFDRETEKRIWAEMEPHLLSEDEDIQRRYLFGAMAGEEDLPPIPGYEFGRKIANAFLENAPDTGIEEWTLMPATEIYEVSQYPAKPQTDTTVTTELVRNAMNLIMGDIKKRKTKQQLFAMVSPSFFESQGITERKLRKLKANYFSGPTEFEIFDAAGPLVDVKLDPGQCGAERVCNIVRFRVGLEGDRHVLVPGKPVGGSEYVSVWEVQYRGDYTEFTDAQRNLEVAVVATNESGEWPWELGRHVAPRNIPVDQGAVVEAAIAARIEAGETMPERVEDPGYEVANCGATGIPAAGWLSDGMSSFICENTAAGKAMIRWRAWYCKNERRCVLGRWPGGRFPANTDPLEYTTRSNLGSVQMEFRPPTWQPEESANSTGTE